jgi:hypothetical protein
MLDQGPLADPGVGLAQPDAMRLCQTHQPLARTVQQPGIGREGDCLGLHRGVDDDAGEVRRLRRIGARGRDRLSCSSAVSFPSPMR